jgi:eukaryotic translation initiation factor 2C
LLLDLRNTPLDTCVFGLLFFWVQIIFFYRHGIRSREFKKVLSTEVAHIKSGAHAVRSNYDPKVTLVVVSTKHPTRLFLDDAATSSANVPAGTVVDEDVCHPQEFDFYLCSHAGGAHGTSRPTHYHVLCDEANLK